MNNECIDIEDLAVVLELPDDDPRRRHLEECPRCSSALLSFQTFLEAGSGPGSNMSDAESRLDDFITTNFKQASPETTERVVSTERPGFFVEFVQNLFRRPVWVAAALVVFVAGMVWWQPWVADRPVLRGTTPAETGTPLELADPQFLEDGGVRLSWIPFDGADGYEVRLYDKNFSELARFGPLTDTFFMLDVSTLPESAPATVVWRVTVLIEGDAIAHSQPASLKLR